jgi:FkbM family methyltransferase
MRWTKELLGRLALKLGLSRDTVSLKAALRRSIKRDGYPASIIDVGASDGCWSKTAYSFYPEACYLLIEAQEGHRPSLERFIRNVPNSNYLLAAAGDVGGSAFFDVEGLFGGLAAHEPVGNKCISVPMVTVDDAVIQFALPPPYLLKLDTHGFEVPILQGAKNILKETSLVIIECYNFKLTANSLKFHEMCTYMEKSGFSCIDLVQPMFRPCDKAFWQMDLFFIPSNNTVFSSNSYEP